MECQASDAVYKCRKCRFTLFSEEFVVNAHGNGISPSCDEMSSNECPKEATADCTVWFLRDDGLPVWVEGLVNEANWIKGKISCPKCNGKIGSFDFVNGSKCLCGQCVLPSVHVVKCKIDRENLDEVSIFQDRRNIEKHDIENTLETNTDTPAAQTTSRSLSNELESSFQMQDLRVVSGELFRNKMHL